MTEVLANTDMIRLMLEHGITPRLPEVIMPDEFVASHPDFVSVKGADNDIVSVEYDCDEEVQCIEIDDSKHLYLTDGYIPTHNTSNIIFLKSTDDSMIETLQKMSGTTHKVFRDSKTITKDKERLFLQNEGKITYTYTAKEVPTIAYNDMAFISPRNSIVFRAGDSPIWNRNETILPMSWKLFSDTIVQPGKDYTLQTIPTLSSALDFDVRKNQPDFFQMVEKRKLQARYSDSSLEAYKKAYGYNDYAFEQLDPDVRSDELMEVINQAVLEYLADKAGVREEDLPPEYDINDKIMEGINMGDYEDNLEQEYATAQCQEEYAKVDTAKFAGGTISPNQLVGMNGQVNHGFDTVIVRAFKECKAAMFKDTDHFKDNNDGSLYGADGTLYIHRSADGKDAAALNRASQDAGSRVYAEEDVDVEAIGNYKVKDAFLRFLAKQESWDFAGGKFDEFIRKDNGG